MGSARDIVEQCGVPRFLFVDYPLGNPCGRPDDVEDQAAVLEETLTLLESATAPRTTVQSASVWTTEPAADIAWRANYMEIRPENLDDMRAWGDARRTAQATAPGRPR
ncbi:MAG: hypothetical protein HKN26_02060 [Acidimicrobiales bacterium]|nr:hypothetical protein [Acidimicrobiales bacterium]